MRHGSRIGSSNSKLRRASYSSRGCCWRIVMAAIVSLLVVPIRSHGGYFSGKTSLSFLLARQPTSASIARRRGRRATSSLVRTSAATTTPFSTLDNSHRKDDGGAAGDANWEGSNPTNLPMNRWTKAGFEHSLTEFATHVVVEQDGPMRLSDLVDLVLDGVVRKEQQQQPATSSAAPTTITGAFLVELGSVWHLPHGGPARPELGGKPVRVVTPDFAVRKGDYVRIHHNPRRFADVHRYDWAANVETSPVGEGPSGVARLRRPADDRRRPGVVVGENSTAGWLVVDKPMRVPVHMTVDNCRENVQCCVKEARQRQRQHKVARTQNGADSLTEDSDTDNDDDDDVGTNDCYVSTPQRLDQNTSGLLVVATSKAFANYYAGLLRHKTHKHVAEKPDPTADPFKGSANAIEGRAESTSVHKLYRCLVCLLPSPTSEAYQSDTGGSLSVLEAAASLRQLAEANEVVRHYLEPSIRSPKRFVREVPVDAESEAGSWQECLLRIRKVGPVCALLGNGPGHALAAALWPTSRAANEDIVGSSSSSSSRRPTNVQAVVELEIELLTGRTHQIRGQLSEAGYPIVGDAQYGGATSVDVRARLRASSGDDQLALQCCALDFLDPDIVKKQDGTVDLKRSSRWNRFRLNYAWWTSHLNKYQRGSVLLSEGQRTTDLAADTARSDSATPRQGSTGVAKPHLLPERVSLSPGRNKYVLVRASHPTDASAPEEWFVKSAAPGECGGPYHGNVAQDLREWIEAAGYEARVTGGGRICYRPDENCATVYGFSYAFGRGDHNRAAELIRRTGVYATIDPSPDLY